MVLSEQQVAAVVGEAEVEGGDAVVDVVDDGLLRHPRAATIVSLFLNLTTSLYRDPNAVDRYR